MKSTPATSPSPTPAKHLTALLAKFSPDIEKAAKTALRKIRARVPGAVEFVYDNTYALVVGFGPNDRPSDAIFSIVISPRKVTLCFLWGVHLDDPGHLLNGAGNQVRHLSVTDPKVLDTPPVRALMAQALADADPPIDPKARRRLLIRLINATPRPRRPASPPEKRRTRP